VVASMAPNPIKLIGFGGIHGTKPYKCIGVGGIHYLAVLKAKIKIKNHRIRARICPIFLRKMAVRTLPRDPLGEDQTL
jgi:hypothetical protein